MQIESIGDATLYCGDCLDVLPTLGQVDAVVTDPPYAVSVKGSAYQLRGTRRLDFFPGDDDWESMVALVSRAAELTIALKPLSAIWWCGHRQIGPLVAGHEKKGFSTRMLIWEKECPPPAPPGTGFSSGAEFAVYATTAGATKNVLDNESNVFKCDSYRHGQPGKFDHPTQKPSRLLDWCLTRTTPESALVLDPFMGSGTTGVACANLGRKFIGIEMEQKYFDIACERIEMAYSQGRLFA